MELTIKHTSKCKLRPR